MKGRVLILGANGMLGSDLRATLPSELHLATPSARIDIREADRLERALDELSPEWVVNAAAFTRVDDAERDRDEAWAINAVAPGVLARLCARRRIHLVHFSTDYVFAGHADRPYREDDPTSPVNSYGASKLEGEAAVLAESAASLVLRTQWLFGRAGRSFPRTMWQRATQRLVTRVVNDQTGRPTYTVDLAEATWRLVAAGASGLYHVANEGIATWFDVAALIFDRCDASVLVSPCTTAEYPTPAKRPHYSALDTGKLQQRFGITLPGWQDAVIRFSAVLDGELVKT